MGRGGDEEGGRQAGREQGGQVEPLLSGRETVEAGVERHNEKEREEHLHAWEGHAKLAE